jgi:hypothetical protein
MTNEDRPKFAERMVALAELYSTELSAEAIEIYFRALHDINLEGFQRAVSEAARRCKFFPKPVELLELVSGGNAHERASNAWMILQGAVGSHGSYRSVEFEDPVAGRAVQDMGGWLKICRPAEDEVWMRKRFLELYAMHDRNRPYLPKSPVLEGLTASQNRCFSDWVDHPALVPSAVESDRALLTAPTEQGQIVEGKE